MRSFQFILRKMNIMFEKLEKQKWNKKTKENTDYESIGGSNGIAIQSCSTELLAHWLSKIICYLFGCLCEYFCVLHSVYEKKKKKIRKCKRNLLKFKWIVIRSARIHFHIERTRLVNALTKSHVFLFLSLLHAHMNTDSNKKTKYFVIKRSMNFWVSVLLRLRFRVLFSYRTCNGSYFKIIE